MIYHPDHQKHDARKFEQRAKQDEMHVSPPCQDHRTEDVPAQRKSRSVGWAGRIFWTTPDRSQSRVIFVHARMTAPVISTASHKPSVSIKRPGKLEARRADCAVLAGKSAVNRLEYAPRARA
jgi:hypothetical protein